jgi:hypothetical protein
VSELIQTPAAASSDQAHIADIGGLEAVDSSLNGYALLTNLGHPVASASNPVVVADDSSPWYQNRVVCREAQPLVFDDKPTAPPPKNFFEQVISIFRPEHRNQPAVEAEVVEVMSPERSIVIDLGSGASIALPIGIAMPLRKDWTWVPEIPTEATEPATAPAPAAEPEWNEAEDEMPTWVRMDSIEYRSGALMSRRPSGRGG